MGNYPAGSDLVKWLKPHLYVQKELHRLQTITKGLPFAKGHDIHYGLFLKETPKHPDAARVYYPSDVFSF